LGEGGRKEGREGGKGRKVSPIKSRDRHLAVGRWGII